MSTVIPYGAKINVTPDEFFNFVASLEKPIRRVWDKEAKKMAAYRLLLAYVSEEHSTHSILTTAEIEWIEVLKRLPDIYDTMLKLEVTFGLSNEGNILANPFGARSLIERFHKIKKVEDYSYDNRAGPDDYGLSQEGYDRREREWASLFDEHDSFASLVVWSLPRAENIFAPMMLDKKYSQDVIESITPEDIARMTLERLGCKKLGVEKSDHKTRRAVEKWVSSVPLADLGKLPDPLTRKSLNSKDRSPYQAPPGLLDTCPTLK